MPQPVNPGAEPVTGLAACHDCDLLFPAPHLRKGEKASCPRCGAKLFERKGNSIDQALALALTSLVLFILANFNTLLTMKVAGRSQSGAIISGVQELYRQGYWEIAILVFVVSILAPLLKILSIFYVLAPLKLGFRLPYGTFVFRIFETLHPWAMTEVYMLGILVALVKLADLASIETGIALWSVAALIVTMAATDSALENHEIWEKLETTP
jgi:paraquat-inducible protein A